MTESNASTKRGDISVFMPQTPAKAGQHIIDVLIEERCPSFADHWTWPIIRLPLLSMLGYFQARKMADHLQGMGGAPSFDYLAEKLAIKLDLNQFDRIPKTGRLVIAANHPTGLADGAAVWAALQKVRRDVVFFANADAIRVNPGFEDVLIPVEWVIEKRSPSKARETLRRAGEAFAQEKCVVIFPSGKLARMVDGKLWEQEWFSSVVSMARKQKAPILPLNIDARNSALYYWLSKTNGELRDITLFRELLNKKGDLFKMTAGPLIGPDQLSGDVKAITEALREYVSYTLNSASQDATFHLPAPEVQSPSEAAE
ncbi:MAG: 1-acyl-sn-glycerol-3-phosphate acyltransferase [Pseudomonadota bacterium]